MDLSIIIPCYNEGRKIKHSIEQIISFMNNENRKNITYEMIIVNDGSTDDTMNFLNNEVSTYLDEQLETSKIKRKCLVSYTKNKGKGYAIKKGIEVSLGDTIIFMDADLSTNLLAIDDVLKYRKDYDVIIGSRRLKDSKLEKKQGIMRQITGKGCLILTNLIVPLNIIDTQCGFKAFNGNYARKMIKKQKIYRFAFDVEYLYISKLNNKTIKEIPVIWENDEDSKVSLINSSIDFFKSLFIIRKRKNSYRLKD